MSAKSNIYMVGFFRILMTPPIPQTYGCLAISLLSMALSIPESRDKTADSIAAITINLELIVVVDINLEPAMVSIKNPPKESCSRCVC